MGDSALGFGDVAAVMALGAMPWLNMFIKPLRWHLETATVPVFNAVATICAAIISLIYFSSPEPSELFVVTPWWLLLFLFFVPCAIYFALFILYRDSVKADKLWPLLVGLCVYVVLYCSLAIVAGNLEVRRNYRIVRGAVVETGGAPVEGARVDFLSRGRRIARGITEDDGEFRAFIDRSESLNRLLVSQEGFAQHEQDISGEGVPSELPVVKLEREGTGG